jgi:PrgI family protein
MPINPVKVPQNVYVEDRVVGQLTLRQIILMIIGGGISYVFFIVVQKTYGTVTIPITVICWIPFLITTAFAILKVNDLTLFRIVLLSLERMHKSPDRVWVPRKGLCIHVRTGTILKEEEEEERKRKAKKRPTLQDTNTQIQQLSSIVDQGLEFDDPVADEIAASAPEKTTESISPVTPPPPRLPVDKSQVRVNDPAAAGNPAGLSDLSIFRDVFNPKQSK